MTPQHHRPPFDPEVAPLLAAFMASGAPTEITPEHIADLRAFSDAYVVADESYEGVSFADHRAPGPAGAPDISVLVVTPDGLDPDGRHPAMLYIHGGGMISGDRRTALATAVDWATELGMIVASVEYRLAPEHPGDALVEDCYAGLRWVAEHAAELGIDVARLLVGGGSAGGGLAASVALLARDRNGPALAGQLLMCPMLDDRTDARSHPEFTTGALWTTTANETGWRAVLGDAVGTDDVSPYIAAARATDLAGLAPAFIDVGSAELFRDEDVDYASRIWRAGGVAELHVWPGGFHGYDVAAAGASISVETRAARLRWLRRVLEQTTVSTSGVGR